MKLKIKFENVFVVFSLIFIFGCCCFYGYRLVKYYRVFNPKTETGEKVETLSATIRKDSPVIADGDGLYIHNGDFVFKGEKVNNYVSYNDKIWRVLQVYRSGLVKMVLDTPLTNLDYGETNTTYDKSKIYEFIKNENNLKINTNNLEKTSICLDEIDDTNKITCTKKIDEYVSILGISDYATSLNAETKKSFITGENSIWLYNKNSEGLAWNITEGMLNQDDLSNEYEVRPVITLKNNSHSEAGDGTKNNPYIVKDGE